MFLLLLCLGTYDFFVVIMFYLLSNTSILSYILIFLISLVQTMSFLYFFQHFISSSYNLIFLIISCTNDVFYTFSQHYNSSSYIIMLLISLVQTKSSIYFPLLLSQFILLLRIWHYFPTDVMLIIRYYRVSLPLVLPQNLMQFFLWFNAM